MKVLSYYNCLKCLVLFACAANISFTGTKPLIKDIQTHELSEALVAPGRPLLLDARTGSIDDFKRIPGALHIPYNSTEAAIFYALPQKEQAIIVYGSHERCPSSKYLAERLVRLGYTNVSKYSEGLKTWISCGYNIDTPSSEF